jgi:hypothetical protein
MHASAMFEQDRQAQALVEAYLARMAEIQRTGADPAASDDLAAIDVEVGRNGILMALLDAEAAFTALLQASSDRISERSGRPFFRPGRASADIKAPDAVDVLARADDLGDALQRAMGMMDSDAFDLLIAECNALVRQITRVDPNRFCSSYRVESAGSLIPSVRDVTGRA